MCTCANAPVIVDSLVPRTVSTFSARTIDRSTKMLPSRFQRLEPASERFDGEVASAVLSRAHICPMQASQCADLLLRETRSLAQSSEDLAHMHLDSGSRLHPSNI